MSDGFLARWSRRKRDEIKRDEARRPAVAVPTAPEVAPSADAAPRSPAEDGGTLSPEELARLPSLDALTATTDLAPFLRAGVPRALRNAALRRMWSLDPAIRDFVSEAREYAYDWNTPGGVPGSGGLIPAEEVRAMVERVFGGTGAAETGVPGEDSEEGSSGETGTAGLPPSNEIGHSNDPHGRDDPQEGMSPPEQVPGDLPSGQRPVLGFEPSPRAGGPDGSYEALEFLPVSRSTEEGSRPSSNRRGPEPSTLPRLRRHGGALPF